MRPTLKNPSVADEDLIEVMSMAMSAETECLNKFGASGRAKQASVSSPEMAKSNIKEKKEDGRVLAALKAVQSDKTLQETVSKGHKRGNRARGKWYVCTA
jgi:hypothetical protein